MISAKKTMNKNMVCRKMCVNLALVLTLGVEIHIYYENRLCQNLESKLNHTSHVYPHVA